MELYVSVIVAIPIVALILVGWGIRTLQGSKTNIDAVSPTNRTPSKTTPGRIFALIGITIGIFVLLIFAALVLVNGVFE